MVAWNKIYKKIVLIFAALRIKKKNEKNTKVYEPVL